MNKLIVFFSLLLLNIGCDTGKQQTKKTPEIALNETSDLFVGPKYIEKLYDLEFLIENLENNEFQLSIAIKLYNGGHYISPHAKRTFSGKFFMDLGSYTDLAFKGDIIETPRSVETIDLHPFTNGTVNWVHVNTTYKQSLQVKSQDDFEVFGRVMFTIEPRCTLENIPFVIAYKAGKMTVKRNPKC